MIILVGPVGSGAHELANELSGRGLTVADANKHVEEKSGLSLSDISITRGAEVYNKAERESSLAALESGKDVVVLSSGALGNSLEDEKGTEVRAKISELVASGATKYFLTAEAKVLMERAGLNVPRSVAIGSPRSTFLTQLKAREAVYAAEAEKVDTSSGDWEALALRITGQ